MIRPKSAGTVLMIGLTIAVLLLVQGPAFGENSPYRRVFTNQGFLVDSIIQLAAADVLGNGRDQILVLGRNYEARETFLYVVSWDDNRFQVLWKSPNLYGSPGHMAVAAGDFMGSGTTQVLLISDERSVLYRWQDGGLRSVWRGSSPWPVQEIAVLKAGNGQPDMVVLTKVVSKNRDYAPENVNILKWTQSGFKVLAQSPAVGVIRSLAAGRVVGNTTAEVLMDVGQETKAGQVEVWTFRNGKVVRLSSQGLSSTAVFGLTVFTGGEEVVLADDSGKVGFYRWKDSRLVSIGTRVSLGWGLVSCVAGRFSEDGGKAVVVAEYPNVMHVLIQ